MSTMPFRPSPPASPGIPLTGLKSALNGGLASPQTATLTLPGYGIYDAVITARHSNSNNTGVIHARISYYKFDASGAQAAVLAKSTTLATHLSGSPSTLSGLTLSDPDAAGVVTVTITWSDGQTHPSWASCQLRTLVAEPDIAPYPN